MKEKKTEYIMMKATPSFKARAKALADEEGRSLSNYIEWLINNDAKRREGEILDGDEMKEYTKYIY